MEENKWCVYRHLSPSGKSYIGITCKKPEYRWRHGKGYFYNEHFTCAINKYGWDNFKHEILFKDLKREEAGRLEQICIALFRSNDNKYGYNITFGGEGAIKRCIMTEKARQHLRDIQKQKQLNGEYRPIYCLENDTIYPCASIAAEILNIPNNKIRSVLCDSQKSTRGKHFCYIEEIEKLKNKNLKNNKFREVYYYETKQIYYNLREAARQLNISNPEGVTKVCQGKQLTCRGYHFCYIENLDEKLKEGALYGTYTG